MQREIKFRIWNSKENKFVVYSQDDIIPPEEDVMDIFREENEETGLVFLQYTGLQDKNGKGIYEGDIIKSFGEVCFFVGKFGFHLSDSDGRWFDLSDVDWRNLEVIGDIFENPELLKNEQVNTK